MIDNGVCYIYIYIVCMPLRCTCGLAFSPKNTTYKVSSQLLLENDPASCNFNFRLKTKRAILFAISFLTEEVL